MRTRNSFLLAVAKTAAVAVALGVLAWFVVMEQRRANPAPPLAVPAVQSSDASAPASATSADPAVFLPSSKVLAIDAQPGLDEAVFLMGSKSGIVAPTASGAGPDAQVVPPQPVFLGNSKSGVWTESPLPPSLVFPPLEIHPPSQAPAVPPEPVFLPNSKSRVLGGLVRPNLTPAAPEKSGPQER